MPKQARTAQSATPAPRARRAEHAPDRDGHEEKNRTARQESDLLVPFVDEVEGARIYDPSILRWALIGAALGALLFGWLAASLAYGNLPVVGLGPFSASGEGVAVSTGGGVGLAVGGLAGALAALFRLPRRPVDG